MYYQIEMVMSDRKSYTQCAAQLSDDDVIQKDLPRNFSITIRELELQ